MINDGSVGLYRSRTIVVLVDVRRRFTIINISKEDHILLRVNMNEIDTFDL